MILKNSIWKYLFSRIYSFTLPLFVLSIIFSSNYQEAKSESLVKDINGNLYKTIKIGEQIWMAENLKVTKYRNGDLIPQVQEENEWSQLTTGAFCLNEDIEDYKNTYGSLYNYFAIIDNRNIAPEGWHVPTREEWLELENYLGGQQYAGTLMKDIEPGLWQTNIEASNNSGFAAIPAGGRGRLGDPSDVGYYATWWSSTNHDSLYAWHWGLHPDKNSTRRNPGHKASGFSVRCIKDK